MGNPNKNLRNSNKIQEIQIKNPRKPNKKSVSQTKKTIY
jgi:hypothetical protein